VSTYRTHQGYGVDWRDHEGRRHRKYVGTESAARALDAHLKRTRAEAKQLTLPQASALLLAEASHAYLSWISVAPTTLANRRDILKRLNSHLGQQDLHSITAPAIQDYAAELRNNLSASSAEAHLHVIKSLFDWLQDRGILNKNPSSAIRIHHIASEPRHVLTHAEELTLHDMASPRLWPKILTALDAGITRSEISLLRVRHVDNAQTTITTWRPKTARSRQIPMTPRLQNALAPLTEKRHPDAPLFIRAGRSSLPKSTGNTVLATSRRTGINFSLHSLRHSFATRLIQSGSKPHIVRELLGHAPGHATEWYIHATEEEKRDAILNLAEWNDAKLREAQANQKKGANE